MRIAFVTETFLPSMDGVVTRMTRALDWMADNGHEVTVICPDLGCTEYRGFSVRGVRAVRYPVYRSRPWGTPSSAVCRHLAEFDPDIVHAWQPSLVGLPAVRWATKNHVPLVTSYHTDISSYLDFYGPLRYARRLVVWFMRRLNNHAPLTLVTSNAMRDKLREQGFTGLRVLPRGVDLSARDPRFRSEQMRDRLSGGHPERPLLVYVGRASAEKGLDTLEPLIRSHPDWSLAIVGGGPMLERLRERFAGTNTVFTGFLSGEELSCAFASGDVFVFPSVTETLGLVILETMASGVPIVAAKSPATNEQVTSGINGVTYDPADPRELQRAVERLVASPELRANLARAGRADAQANEWSRASAALLGCYLETLDIYRGGWKVPARPGRARSGQADGGERR